MGVELLAPGGSMESMKAALAMGADAVYMGGQLFGARAYAENPDTAALCEAVDYCHMLDKKLYITVNTLLKEDELHRQLYDYILPLYEHGADGILVQDLGVFRFLRREFPDLVLHASTQMSVQSPDGAKMLKEMGAARIVPARELSLEEIRQIHAQTDIEIECFVHGAMCCSYSGQCLMSSMIGGRSGNRGRCAQPCRQFYEASVKEEGRTRKESGYLLSMKDSCTLDLIPQLVEAGICSFKIEGRMKQPAYAAGVTMIYRKYLDLYRQERDRYRVDEADRRLLMDLFNRGGFSTGYYEGINGPHQMAMTQPNHVGTPAARVNRSRGGSITCKALEDLYKGDLLSAVQADPAGRGADHKKGKGSPAVSAKTSGAKTTSCTLERDVAKGGELILRNMGSLPEGTELRRVRSQHVFEQIETQMHREKTIGLYGRFTAQREMRAVLEVSDRPFDDVSAGGGIYCKAVSEEPAAPAQKRPVTAADAEKQLRKTGGTLFSWTELTVNMEEGLFLPLTQINALRREVLEAYTERKLQAFYRKASGEKDRSEKTAPDMPDPNAAAASELLKSCFVRTWAQLEEVLRADFVQEVMVDSLLFMDPVDSPSVLECLEKIQKSGKKAILAWPPVWRAKTRDAFKKQFPREVLEDFDGHLLRCMDQLPAADALKAEKKKRKQLPPVCIADYNIYEWNHLAAGQLKDLGADRCTAPLEQNRREMRQFDRRADQFVIYGRAQMMTTAQCVMKNAFGCSQRPAALALTDSHHAVFPVLRHCSICTSEILNSLPTDLIPFQEDIRGAGISCLRMDFTVESGEETRKVLQYMQAALQGRRGQEIKAATRGHFKRGVE